MHLHIVVLWNKVDTSLEISFAGSMREHLARLVQLVYLCWKDVQYLIPSLISRSLCLVADQDCELERPHAQE